MCTFLRDARYMAKISVLKLYSTVPKYLHVSKHETSAPAFFVYCAVA